MKYLNFESKIYCTLNEKKVPLTSNYGLKDFFDIIDKLFTVNNEIERKFLFFSGGD